MDQRTSGTVEVIRRETAATNVFELLGIGAFDEADETYDTFDGLFNRIFEERLG